MATVSISKKPNIMVSSLTLKRTGSKFRATWKIPSDARKESNKARWERQRVVFVVWVGSTDKKGKWVQTKKLTKTYEVSLATTAYTIDASDVVKKVYPNVSSPFLTKVDCTVYAKNGKGLGSGRLATYTMAKPVSPSLSIEFDAETNKATAKRTAKNDSSGTKHRYDTVLSIKWVGPGSSGTFLSSDASTAESRTKWYFVNGSDALLANQWMRVDATAWNRGWRGASGKVVKSVYIAHPSVPKCGAPVLERAQKGIDSTASILVPVSAQGLVVAKDPSGGKANVWPETLYLQRLRNSTATTSDEAAGSSGWEAVDGAEAMGSATGLMDTWSAATEDREPGKRTWYRVVAVRDGHTQVGIPVWAECLYVPAAEESAGDAAIGEIASGTDGESIVVPVTWTNASHDGVELSWSVHEDAWRSNARPDTLDVDWGSNLSATATIRGLETGVPVYVRARCYDVSSGSDKTYGAYSDAKMAIPYDAPDNVEATVPPAVAAGDEIPVEWTFGSGSVQQWADVLVDGTAVSAVEGDGGHTVNGSSGAATVPSEGLSPGVHEIAVVVSTDGASGVSSGTSELVLADPPTCAVSAKGAVDEEEGSATQGETIVSAQPLVLLLETSADDPSATFSIASDGCSADGVRDAQHAGQVVWRGLMPGSRFSPPADSTEYTATADTEVVDGKPYYELADGSYALVSEPSASGLSGYYEYTGTAWEVELPSGIDLRDGCGYSVACTVEDGLTGLSSSAAQAAFAVRWSHQAVAPEGEVTTGGDGSAVIAVPLPDGADATDVIDLYRMTPGGLYLIASGREPGVPITDPYAPYRSRRSDAELRYRAVLRTVDGDIEFADIGYDLVCGSLRLDWGGRSIELPYDISRSDSFSKDFASRVHADGSRGGFWSPAVEHGASLSTNLVKIRSAAQRELLMDMANHPGPVFVRTPEGMAYPANVNLGSIEVSTQSMAVSASIDAQEVGMTSDFMAVPVDGGGEG